jgi:hypothetical protein
MNSVEEGRDMKSALREGDYVGISRPNITARAVRCNPSRHMSRDEQKQTDSLEAIWGVRNGVLNTLPACS